MSSQVDQTLSGIRTKVRVDLDLQDEVFIVDSELNSYINEGVRDAEAEIHGIYQDYFLAEKSLDLVNGQQEYRLPNNIYAHKIRGIIFDDQGVNTHKIKPIKDFQDIPYILETGSSQYYRYVLKNEPKGPRLKLYPIPNTSNPLGVVTIWYLREARQLLKDTDELDIPEFLNFILAYAKLKCLHKEGHPGEQMMLSELEKQRGLMQSTLEGRTVDEENFIPLDMQHYQETI